MRPPCSHQWRLRGGCLQCTRPHPVAPYIAAGNHRALEPGRSYQCRCGASLTIPRDTEAEACAWCGEEACERSCTGALLADEGEGEDAPSEASMTDEGVHDDRPPARPSVGRWLLPMRPNSKGEDTPCP